MTTPQTQTKHGKDLVLVNDGPRFGYDYQGFEEVRGLARYADGSLILVTHRVNYTNDPAVPFSAPMAYRTFLDNPDGPWQVIDILPDPLREFITTQPAGATAAVSDRHVEVLDYATTLAGNTIDIERGAHLDHWVTY
jgi:hypothetical protein